MRNVVAKRALIERYVISEQQGAGRGKREKEKKLFSHEKKYIFCLCVTMP